MQSILGNNTRKADIIFHATGRIDIASHVAKQLQLTSGDVLDIMKDPDGEYYLYVKHRAPLNGRYEAMAFPTNRRGNHFRAYSRPLCSAILQTSGADSTARLCTGQPVNHSIYAKLIPIITKRLL